MNAHAKEIARYIVNGLVATAVHYGVLTMNLKLLGVPSAGLANLIAAVFGITTSFLGNRYFVFTKSSDAFIPQAFKFMGLYGAIALLHGVVLFIWTDHYGIDYRAGFLVATCLQLILSYLGNKFLIFSK